MTSEDVIHDFYVPAFRIHTDVIPGRYTTQWFTPSQVGSYRLFCSQYCGTGHSSMIGEVIVMSAADYQAWSSGGGTTGGAAQSPAAAGAQLFTQMGCIACHTGNAGAPAPALAGIYGKPVELSTGQTVVADENYIRESILNPSAKIVKGFQPIMPSFQGRLTTDQINALIAYIQSLGTQSGSTPAAPGAAGGVSTPPPPGSAAGAATPGGVGATPAVTRSVP
jgi:cytochrome c oxidase subunit 2